MKVTVYSNKDIFENIILDADKYPVWNSILNKYSDVCLDISDEELILDLEKKEDSIIFLFCLGQGGTRPIPLKDYFESQNEDGFADMENKPTSLFLLNKPNLEINELKNKMGLHVSNLEMLNEDALTFEHFNVYSKDQVCNDMDSEGWHFINKFKRCELNSIIINDTHLFDNETQGKNLGVENIIDFIDTMLPQKIDISFHILILTENKKNKAFKNYLKELYDRCKALRNYEINVEIVIGASLHKRLYFANYFTGSIDKGFYFFNNPKKYSVKDVNDHRCEGAFKGVEKGLKIPFEHRKIYIDSVKSKVNSVLNFFNENEHCEQKYIYGDFIKGNEIKNRLYNDLL